MSVEEVLKKYNQLSSEAKKKVDQLLEQLAAKNKHGKDQSVPLFGSLKGKIKMSPDFDEPLEDFKEYM